MSAAPIMKHDQRLGPRVAAKLLANEPRQSIERPMQIHRRRRHEDRCREVDHEPTLPLNKASSTAPSSAGPMRS